MKNQFIPYELALKLKELGFDEDCLTYYAKHLKDLQPHLWDLKQPDYPEYWDLSTKIGAPLWQQAFDWFREKHKMHSSVDFWGISQDNDEEELFEYRINEQWHPGAGNWYDYNKFGFKHLAHYHHFKSYPEAQQQCLEKLIKLLQIKQTS